MKDTDVRARSLTINVTRLSVYLKGIFLDGGVEYCKSPSSGGRTRSHPTHRHRFNVNVTYPNAPGQ